MNLAQTDKHAIVTLLDPKMEKGVVTIWDRLAEHCQTTGLAQTPIPHFSWSVAGNYDFPQLETFLAKKAMQIEPFVARTAGLGMFSGPQPILYIPVVKGRQLLEMHEYLWIQVVGLSEDLNPYYSPDNWVPHITIASGDLNARSIACYVELLVEQNFNWEIRVNNLAIIQQAAGEVGKLRSRFDHL